MSEHKQGCKCGDPYHSLLTNFTDIGPECFTNGLVISYKGENYYKACDTFVYDRKEGGQSFCVKRVGHPGKIHEAYDGVTRIDDVLAAYDAEGNLANGLSKYAMDIPHKPIGTYDAYDTALIEKITDDRRRD